MYLVVYLWEVIAWVAGTVQVVQAGWASPYPTEGMYNLGMMEPVPTQDVITHTSFSVLIDTGCDANNYYIYMYNAGVYDYNLYTAEEHCLEECVNRQHLCLAVTYYHRNAECYFYQNCNDQYHDAGVNTYVKDQTDWEIPEGFDSASAYESHLLFTDTSCGNQDYGQAVLLHVNRASTEQCLMECLWYGEDCGAAVMIHNTQYNCRLYRECTLDYTPHRSMDTYAKLKITNQMVSSVAACSVICLTNSDGSWCSKFVYNKDTQLCRFYTMGNTQGENSVKRSMQCSRAEEEWSCYSDSLYSDEEQINSV